MSQNQRNPRTDPLCMPSYIILTLVISGLDTDDLKHFQIHFDNKTESTVKQNTSGCGGIYNNVA